MEIRCSPAWASVSKPLDRKRIPQSFAKFRTNSSSPSPPLPLNRKLQWASTRSNPMARDKWPSTTLSIPPLQAKSRGLPLRKGNCRSICALNLANMLQKYELRAAFLQDRSHGLGLEQAFLVFLLGFRLGGDGTAHGKGHIVSI